MSNLSINFQRLTKINPNANALYPTTHSMIMHYSDRYKDYRKNAKGSKALAEKLGVKNFNKFYTNRKLWDSMSNRIPIYYLEAIGISESMIATTIELDQEIFDKAVEVPVIYEYFTQSYKWFFIRSYFFSEPLYEPEAIERVKIWITKDDFEFFGTRSSLILSRKPFYDIWFNKVGSHHHYHRPLYQIHNKYYEFKMPYQTGWRI